MSETPLQPTGGMESGGAYNRYATVQAAGALTPMQLLETTARDCDLSGDGPIVIVDYGSSQGRNSLPPMRAAIEALRARAGPDRPIWVYHEDLPLNDFNALFAVVATDPDSYLRNRQNVFASAIARSFYEPVLPANSVHLGWSSYAAQWFSRIPTTIPDHFAPSLAKGETRAAFEAQGAVDWARFLALRSEELRRGGKLVVAVPGMEENGATGFERLANDANGSIAQMVNDGLIAADERARIVVGAIPRRRSELLAPFARHGRFHGLEAEHCQLYPVDDLAWLKYKEDGFAEALAATRAAFFRVTFGPSLAGVLSPERRPDFLNALESGIKRRQADHPAPMNTFVAAIVVAKSV
jgi:hypothetical protein